MADIKVKNQQMILLVLLLSADVVFIIIDIIYRHTDFLSLSLYAIDKDLGYAEIYQYLKEFWIMILFALYFFYKKSSVFLIWSGLFFYFLLDDIFSIHESLGKALRLYFHLVPMGGLRAQDFGELMASFFVGCLFLPVFWLTYSKSGLEAKKTTMMLIKFLCFLALAGVGLDMLHSLFRKTALNSSFVLLEDGGEMVIMSFIFWYIFNLVAVIDKPDAITERMSP